MADEEELASQEAVIDDAQAPHEEDTQQAANPIEALASEMGWAPKDQFRGDPEKWRPADEFIREGHNIQRTLSRELKGVKQEVERFGRIAGDLVQDKVAERDAYWKAQHTKAVDEGDHEAADKALEELRRPTEQPRGPDPTAAAWVAKNEWFNTDPLARIRATEISDKLAAQGVPVAEQLAQAERAIRKEFPEHFPAPAKDPPGTQTGTSRRAVPTNRARGFADMPAESQQMARDMNSRNPSVTLEAIAKSYWADVANQRRA